MGDLYVLYVLVQANTCSPARQISTLCLPSSVQARHYAHTLSPACIDVKVELQYDRRPTICSVYDSAYNMYQIMTIIFFLTLKYNSIQI